MVETENFIKHRIISFQNSYPEEDQAQRAMLLLSGINGVDQVYSLDSEHLSISYDIRCFTLFDIENVLQEVGFHLSNSPICKLKRALYEYTESAQRANLGLHQQAFQGQCTEKIFVQKYRHRKHGCRDKQPLHWRNYR